MGQKREGDAREKLDLPNTVKKYPEIKPNWREVHNTFVKSDVVLFLHLRRYILFTWDTLHTGCYVQARLDLLHLFTDTSCIVSVWCALILIENTPVSYF